MVRYQLVFDDIRKRIDEKINNLRDEGYEIISSYPVTAFQPVYCAWVIKEIGD